MNWLVAPFPLAESTLCSTLCIINICFGYCKINSKCPSECGIHGCGWYDAPTPN
jgi:hypothetical protein